MQMQNNSKMRVEIVATMMKNYKEIMGQNVEMKTEIINKEDIISNQIIDLSTTTSSLRIEEKDSPVLALVDDLDNSCSFLNLNTKFINKDDLPNTLVTQYFASSFVVALEVETTNPQSFYIGNIFNLFFFVLFFI